MTARHQVAALGRRIRTFSPRDRYGLVLVLIVLTYAQASLVGREHIATETIILTQLVTVWLVFGASASLRFRRVTTGAILVAGVVTLIGGTLGAVLDSSLILRVLYLINIALYAMAPVVVVKHVMQRRTVDAETLLAALNAYLLIGMMFAFTYRYLGAIAPMPFFAGQGEGTMADDLFFSFVTLTSTGYGDLVPATQLGQSLAVMEMIAGQFFIAGVVAKIVTAWRPADARALTDDTADDEDVT